MFLAYFSKSSIFCFFLFLRSCALNAWVSNTSPAKSPIAFISYAKGASSNGFPSTSYVIVFITSSPVEIFNKAVFN